MDQAAPPVNSETMYKNSGANPSVLARNITASDDDELSPWPRAIRIGVGGDVTIKNVRGETVLFTDMQVGEVILCTVSYLMDTGTDATDFVAYYG